MPKIDPARAADLLASDKGCRVLDAAIMPLAGYHRESDGWWRRGAAGDYRYDAHLFCTAGDGDPYARGDLVMAMTKALRNAARWIEVSDNEEGIWISFVVNGVTCHVGPEPTRHRALVLALAAAGLLEEIE